jgi:hypothetical protein
MRGNGLFSTSSRQYNAKMLRILICTFLLLKLTAAVEFTNTASSLANIQAGTAFDITWTDATGPVTLLLKDGPATALQTVLTIACKYGLVAALIYVLLLRL